MRKSKILAPTPKQNMIIKLLIILGLVSILNFIFYFAKPEFRGNTILYILLSISLFYGILKKLYLWYNYSNISLPKTTGTEKDFTVDVLTTYFPGEPYQMIITTLEAIIKINYPHETYLCDEADDPYLKQFCESNGIHHVTRLIKKDAKAGNINNALEKVARGEITVILDPDHIPDPDFLDEIIPYFSNPEIGFVQTVQGYYNIKETLVAQGAAEQTFQFYGPMMMTLNAYGSVNAIGANCVFRRSALDSIGGHAAGLCEDMHTTMKLYAKNWKGIYLPKILAQGLAPSSLTGYYKQQLKWSRGTFDLLFKVYPRLFKYFSYRQKIHFGILPLHYLSGIICLLNFLIPVVSLLFSITPWQGNFIDFGLALLPVVFSSILIRTYIQNWVIQRKERGFHLLGGLLEINTWWIYVLGFIYTLFDKNIPYLPTPKENEFATNYKIILPNTIVAIISIAAVIYGLSINYTPFALVMSGFALFNAAIMIFGIYLTVKTTNENNILKNTLSKSFLRKISAIKVAIGKIRNIIFIGTRSIALPLLLTILCGSLWFIQKKATARWDNITPTYIKKQNKSYLGIFHPISDTGTVSLRDIDRIENEQNINFNIVSFYLAWKNNGQSNYPGELINSIDSKGAIPMITWEPWLETEATSTTKSSRSSIFSRVSAGLYDDYIIKFGKELAVFDKPVFLRFAHEFDNPQYPWSHAGNQPELEFKKAWIHVYNLIKDQGAYKTIFVWNPWKPKGMQKYYPGDKYVDWVGITALNYGYLNQNEKSVSFQNIYSGFHERRKRLTSKPVMLTEFGSVNLLKEENQIKWLKNARKAIETDFEEISAIVFFNSAFDDNIPEGKLYAKKYIEWTTDSLNIFADYATQFLKEDPVKVNNTERYKRTQFAEEIRGVRYKKGINWKENYYTLNRQTLLEDFKLMQEINISTIFYPGGNVYDYNTLKYASKTDMRVIYDFGAAESYDKIDNSLHFNDFENEVLEKIAELEKYSNVIGFSFDVFGETSSKPYQFEQLQRQLGLYNQLLSKIRYNNSTTPIILNLELNSDTRSLLSYLNELNLEVDYFGLIVSDTTFLSKTLNFATANKIPTLITSISPENTDSQLKQDPGLILSNWQDERLSSRLSFDGLLDFKGRKKSDFNTVHGIWNQNSPAQTDLSIRILKPAVPIIANETVTFNAMLFSDSYWVSVTEANKTYNFEWTLLKFDSYSNPLALRVLGSGPKISFSIPEEYQEYKLLLTVVSGNEVITSTITKLNTPL
ncbi:glycosyltransferase [uncultured Christiangramia sp.]|uniref:glycosyltransferase n=1 Tax=uncultured Christiangramia sp. TaxID=503836 RepID=UPI00261335C3|nr:glycosyltransferase [uncultured Christiangramia sp.]